MIPANRSQGPDQAIATLTHVIADGATISESQIELLQAQIQQLPIFRDDQLVSLLNVVIAAGQELEANKARLLVSLFARMLALIHQRLRTSDATPLPSALIERLRNVYLSVPADSILRGYVLALMVLPPCSWGLKTFARLIVDSPPTSSKASDLAFAHLFQMRAFSVTDLFPDLLDGLAQTTVAAPIMDLANHLMRRDKLEQHPASSRANQLATLLAGIVERLGRLEEDPLAMAERAEQTVDQITHSVQLAVALCDSLGLIGDRSFIGKLYQTLQLRHRRICTEAASALARLGESSGKDVLVELAAEPVARLRVLNYADELGIMDRIPEEYRTPLAIAEAELAAWLSEPAQFGVAPTSMELVDSRTMYWPGYDEPRMCYLFRYTYEMEKGRYSNIGIAGPLTQSFQADLGNLSPNDLYAMFAGWHALHDEIYEMDAERLPPNMNSDLARWRRRLQDEGYEVVRPLLVGSFFGDRMLVAEASREDRMGTAIVDAESINWYPRQGSQRPLSAEDAYNLVKGGKLLRAFNG